MSISREHPRITKRRLRLLTIVTLATAICIVVWLVVRTKPLTAKEKQLVGGWTQNVNWSADVQRLGSSGTSENREEQEVLIGKLSRTRWIDEGIVLKEDRTVVFLRSFNTLRFGGRGQRGYWKLDGNTVVIQAWPIAAFPNVQQQRESYIKRWYRRLRSKISPIPPQQVGEAVELRMNVRAVHDGLVIYRDNDNTSGSRFLFTCGHRSPVELPVDEGFVEIQAKDEAAFFLKLQGKSVPEPDRVTLGDWPVF